MRQTKIHVFFVYTKAFLVFSGAMVSHADSYRQSDAASNGLNDEPLNAEEQTLMTELRESMDGVTPEMVRGMLRSCNALVPKAPEISKAPEKVQRHTQARIRDAMEDENPAEERARVAEVLKKKSTDEVENDVAVPAPKPVQPKEKKIRKKKAEKPSADVPMGADAEAFVAKVEREAPIFPVSDVPALRDLDEDEYEYEYRISDPDFDYEDDEEYEYEDIDFEALGIDPKEPTLAKPGSEEKVLILAARYAAGVPLWHESDCYEHGPGVTNFAGPQEARSKNKSPPR